MVIVVKHIPIEGPGTIEEFLRSIGRAFKIIDLSLGENLPKDVRDIEAIVSLGGPMNVYEEEKYPFLEQEDLFLKKAISSQVPILGICLGAQLLAKASGARVKKAPQKEIGWYQVELTPEGKADILFNGLSSPLDVFQWHGDTFEIPEKGLLLAESVTCKNQAFKLVGKNTYGLQFHIEITPDMLKDWINTYKENNLDVQDMLKTARRKIDSLKQQAQILCHNFFSMV